MLKELKFNHDMFQALDCGRKCVTRRKDRKEIETGNFFIARDTTTNEQQLMRCTGTYEQKLSDMLECDAMEEGFASIDDFKVCLSDIYGCDYVDSNPKMWVYYFKKA